MDMSEYRARYFVDPPPVPLYAFEGIGGVTLYFAHYDEAVGFYSQVLGPLRHMSKAPGRTGGGSE